MTSREAEFQAWKRRKDYNPLVAARKASSPRQQTRESSAGARAPPQGREMSQSLVLGPAGEPLALHRSSSFHHGALGPHTSEEDSGDDYGSAGDSSAAEGGSLRAPRYAPCPHTQVLSRPRNHFYLDDDELILPVGRPQHRLHDRALYGSVSLSPHTSPSKSRTKQMEALDNLVISTIYNVSSKLCASSSAVLRKTVALLPEQDEEQVWSWYLLDQFLSFL